jgi:tetratricopeptide (TPR) repeat protein
MIRGDLRSIAGQALQKEPQHRYSSVEQFAADIERYIEGRPVAARPDGLLYRARKFVVRRAIPLAAVAAVLLAVAVAGTAAISRGRQAQRRFDQVRSLAHYLIFDVYDSMSRFRGSLAARSELARRTQQYVERFAADAGNDRSLSLEVSESYLRLGDVRGSPYAGNLGDTQGALDSYRKAVAILEREAARQPLEDALNKRLAEAYLNIGRILLRQSNARAALDEIGRGMSLAHGLCQRHPGDSSYAEMLARAYLYLGEQQYQVAMRDTSVVELREALDTYRLAMKVQKAAPHESDFFWQFALGSKYAHVGYALMSLGDASQISSYYCDALAAHEQAARLHAMLGPAQSPQWNVDRTFADDLMTIAYSRWKCRGDLKSALHDTQLALDRFERLAQSDPENLEARRDFANATYGAGQILFEAGRRSEAMQRYRKAVQIYEELGRIDPNSAETQASLARTRARLSALGR